MLPAGIPAIMNMSDTPFRNELPGDANVIELIAWKKEGIYSESKPLQYPPYPAGDCSGPLHVPHEGYNPCSGIL